MDIQPITADGASSFELPNHLLIRASLKNHSPEEIYDFIHQRVGELGMKIKKRQVIIGFENRQFYKKLMDKYQTYLIQGKRIKFHYILNGDENNLQSQQQEIMNFKENSNCENNSFPDLQTFNNVQYKINQCRASLISKIQNLAQGTLDVTRHRTDQLELQFKEQGIRKREMAGLEALIDKRMLQMETKFNQQVAKLNKVIQEFSNKPTEINLQPTFQYEDKFSFPKMNIFDTKFQPYKYYLNAEHYPCKRLCPINGSQFAVTMKHGKYNLGMTKFYDVESPNQKCSINIENGCYGICKVNNFLMIGSCDSSIKYINLEDSDRLVQTSKKVCSQFNTSIFDIKASKISIDKSEIITLSTDYWLRKFQLTFDQVCTGVYSANFDSNWQLQVSSNCYSFEMISPQVILFGSAKSVKKYHIEKKIARCIPTNCAPTKIIKFNSNLYASSSSNKVQLFDLRTDSVVQKFDKISTELRSLQILGDHSIMYGGKGQIGLLDDRKSQEIVWKSQKHHKQIVYDILRLREKVVSVDSKGQIYSWVIGNGSGSGIENGTKMVD